MPNASQCSQATQNVEEVTINGLTCHSIDVHKVTHYIQNAAHAAAHDGALIDGGTLTVPFFRFHQQKDE